MVNSMVKMQAMKTSQLLQAVCLAYWRERQDHPQGDARGILHELVMECFRIAGIEFEDREQAAQIARAIAYERYDYAKRYFTT